MLPWFAALMAVAGASSAGLALYVAWRRGAVAGLALAAMLISVAWWGVAYAVELTVTDLGEKTTWGDLKYVGICGLAPAWLVFALRYTGRARRVTWRLLTALSVEPVLVLGLLAVPATHDTVRYYPPSAAGEALPVVRTGPVFWVHLAYTNAVLLVGTVLFLVTMFRLATVYRRMAVVLTAAALAPWAANLLYNFEVGWFAHLDLTPFAFILTGSILVWGLYREAMINLSPLARGMLMETMGDGVFVLDGFGRISDLNPAGAGLLGRRRGEVIGHDFSKLVAPGGGSPVSTGAAAAGEIVVGEGPTARSFDVSRQPLSDRRGRAAGELLVLRDITDRVAARRALEQLVAERTRVAQALQASLIPGELPDVAGAEMAASYQPAGDGSEIGGDFYDAFALGPACWGIVLGDVSGKGAEAAAVTGLARYTLRTLADPRHAPSHTLRRLNARLLAQTDAERYCTLVYGLVRPDPAGLRLTLALAGHHQPLLRRRDGTVEPIGELGTAIGLLDEVQLHDSDVLVEPGELLCLFTDGLVEARNGVEMFGSDGVCAVLQDKADRPLAGLAVDLVEAARSFHHSPRLADDLALLLLQVRSCSSVGGAVR